MDKLWCYVSIGLLAPESSSSSSLMTSNLFNLGGVLSELSVDKCFPNLSSDVGIDDAIKYPSLSMSENINNSV